MEKKYEDILNFPRRLSGARKRMTMSDRAAQFAPYAALVGFGDVVSETARLTEERAIQDEGEIEKINRILNYILSCGGTQAAEFAYFEKDKKKSGGTHFKKIGSPIKVDEERRLLIFSDNTTLPIDNIVKIELIQPV